MVWILCLAYAQNVSFSVVSRSRNRNNLIYHLFAATISNTVWFVTFRALVTANMNFKLFVPYTIGTVAGSLSGVQISMWIEAWLHAASDSHIVSVLTRDDLENSLAPINQRLIRLEGRIVQVYSRTIRKLRSQRQWIEATFAMQQKLTGLFEPITVKQAETAFEERARIVRELSPKVSFRRPVKRPSRKWINFERAGQLRLGWEE